MFENKIYMTTKLFHISECVHKFNLCILHVLLRNRAIKFQSLPLPGTICIVSIGAKWEYPPYQSPLPSYTLFS